MTRSVLRRTLVAAVLLLLCLPAAAAETAPAAPEVSWRAFDATTLESARKEGRLVFLSILAPWGHWDQVMREVTFRDPRIVRVLNDRFVPVLVDPLEHPDLFARYGMGGWPTTTFVLPTGQPLYYADPNGRIARAGGAFYSAETLLPFLDQMANYYTSAKESAEAAAEEIARAVLARKEVGKAPLTPEIVEASVTLMLEAYSGLLPDPSLKVPRHPDPDAAEIAFAYFIRKGNQEVLLTATRLLAEMSRGGIQDHVGGGFHRFATDAAWRVPAFEKLLAPNAELLRIYTDANRLTQHTRYRAIAEGIAGWALGPMRDAAGWFRPYQAADARLGEDGDYYTWTLEEFRAALSDAHEAWLIAGFDVGEWGEMVESAPRRNVLHLAEGPFLMSKRLGQPEATLEAAFEAGRRELQAARSKRPAPPPGTSLVVDANAAMAGALIRAGAAWSRPDLVKAGIEAIDVAWEKARDPESGLMAHIWSPASGRAAGVALFADQVHMTGALLEAWESTGEERHRERAVSLADAARAAFDDSLNGGWMDRRFDEAAPGLLSWPTRQLRDNALFADSLLRLQWSLGEKGAEGRGKAARKALESWADEFATYKEASAPYGVAVGRAIHAPVEIEVHGRPGEGDWEARRDAARSLYHPWRIIRYVAEGTGIRFCLEGRCSASYNAGDPLRVRLWEFLSPPAAPMEEKSP